MRMSDVNFSPTWAQGLSLRVFVSQIVLFHGVKISGNLSEKLKNDVC